MLKYRRPIDEVLFGDMNQDYYFLDKLDVAQIETVVDVGANIGVTIDYWMRQLPRLKRIVAYEPNDENYALLERNAKDIWNRRPSVNFNMFRKGVYYGARQAKAMAVDHSPAGYVLDVVDKERHADKRFLGKWHQVGNKVFELVELEEYLGDEFAPDFLKLDCEGSEYNIIEHSRIARASRYIGVEFHNPDKTYNLGFMEQYLPKHALIHQEVNVYLFAKQI